MASITLILHPLLEPVAGTRKMKVSGSNAGEALEDAFEQIPQLRHAMTTDGSTLRPHILLVRNGSGRNFTDPSSIAHEEGDELAIMQAISGG